MTHKQYRVQDTIWEKYLLTKIRRVLRITSISVTRIKRLLLWTPEIHPSREDRDTSFHHVRSTCGGSRPETVLYPPEGLIYTSKVRGDTESFPGWTGPLHPPLGLVSYPRLGNGWTVCTWFKFFTEGKFEELWSVIKLYPSFFLPLRNLVKRRNLRTRVWCTDLS